MWLFYGKQDSINLTYLKDGQKVSIPLYMGLNRIDKISFDCIKAHNSANWASLSNLFTVWDESDKNPDDIALPGQTAPDIGVCQFANLTVFEAAQMVAFTNNEDMLRHFLFEESNLGRNRAKVKEMITWKLTHTPHHQTEETAQRVRLGYMWSDLSSGPLGAEVEKRGIAGR